MRFDGSVYTTKAGDGMVMTIEESGKTTQDTRASNLRQSMSQFVEDKYFSEGKESKKQK